MRIRTLVILIFLFFVATTTWAAPAMRIVVAATDQTPAAAVSNNAGPSPYFLVFDQKGKLVETLTNPYKEADSAGPKVVTFLAGKGATVVVAGDFGPRLVEIMKSKGITALSFKGSVQDAVKKALQPK